MLDRLAKLDLKKRDSVVPRLDLKKEDLKKLTDLGQGNGGSVEKVEHISTGTIMAKKVNHLSKHHPLLCRKTQDASVVPLLL
jgi:mitogen-activated protein kinase kinase